MNKTVLDEGYGKTPEEQVETIIFELIDSQNRTYPIAELIVRLNASSKLRNNKTDATNNLTSGRRESEVFSRINGPSTKHEVGQSCLEQSVGAKQSLSSRIQMFEQSNSRNAVDRDSIVTPSRIGSFDREKIENVCRNKIRNQANTKVSELLMSFEFEKNQKTGHYDIGSESQIEKIKSITSSLIGGISVSKNRIKNIIEGFKSQISADSALVRPKLGNEQRSSQFSEIVKKYQESK